MPSPSKHRKLIPFLITAILLTVLIFIVKTTWQGALPKKPEVITIGDYAYTKAYAEHRIQQVMKQKHLPSVAVALIDDQNIIWQTAFGLANLEENKPAQTDTVYKLWSVSKVFTAIETMRLVEEGLIDLDVALTEYLPDFSIQSRFPDPGIITIRNILSQRAGLPRNGCSWVEHSPAELAEIAASLENCYMTLPVETRYKYSNVGFDILGYIVQETRGELFPFYIHENLLMSIGMKNSSFLKAEIPAGREIALGYEYYKGEYYPYEQNDIASLPSGNLYSTAEDLGEFVKFIFRDGVANGKQIIKPDTLQMMYENQFSNAKDPQPQGLGWKIAPVLSSELLVWHDGGPTEGIGALVAFLPERKLGVALIANSTSFEGNVSVLLAVELLELMLETKFGIIPSEEAPLESVEIDRAAMDRFAGKYVAFGEVMEIFMRGSKLKGKIQGISFNLTPLSETTFQPSSWLMDLGLGKVLQVPIDLSELRFEFIAEEDMMIINFGDISYEICPRYPEISEIPLLWEEVSGEYNLFTRLPSGDIGADVVGKTSISIDDGILRMAGFVGPILPISETEFIILSGSFAGETIYYEQETGRIFHQKVVFIKPEENQ